MGLIMNVNGRMQKKHGQGVFTFRFMGAELKYAGEFRNGRGWNIITYDENGEIVGKTVNGGKNRTIKV